MDTSRPARRRSVVVRSSVAAALVALLLLFVLGRGPGSLVWLAGAPPVWLPFAGAGLEWLPFAGGDGRHRNAEPPSPLVGAPVAAVATATPTPSAAPTPTPTPVPAATPRPTPVATPTPTPRPAPTPTPTPRPSPTPAPAPVLFSDTFEADPIGGQPAGWTTSGTFSIVQDSTHVLYTSDASWALATTGQGTWVNYTVTASVKAASTTGHSRLVARYLAASQGYYACGLDHGGYLYLGRVDGGAWTDLKVTPYAFNPSQFYSVSFSVSGTSLTCAVSDPSGALPALTATATDAVYASGGVGWVGEGPGEVDNYKVTAL